MFVCKILEEREREREREREKEREREREIEIESKRWRCSKRFFFVLGFETR